MRAILLAGLALALQLAAGAGANVEVAGVAPFGLDAPHVPQAYCAVVQTEPQARCDAWDLPVRGAQLLRVRIEGEGHAVAYADLHLTPGGCDEGPCQQLPSDAPLDCAATTQASCSRVVGPNVAGVVDLHLLADGPGPAVYSVWLERVLVPLP